MSICKKYRSIHFSNDNIWKWKAYSGGGLDIISPDKKTYYGSDVHIYTPGAVKKYILENYNTVNREINDPLDFFDKPNPKNEKILAEKVLHKKNRKIFKYKSNKSKTRSNANFKG